MKAIAKAGFLASIVVLGGCTVENQSSIAVLGSPAWQYETDTNELGEEVVTKCIAPSDAENFVSVDTFDVSNTLASGGSSFSRPFLVQNNLLNNEDIEAGRLNTKDFIAGSVRVEYAGVDDATRAIVEGLGTEVPTSLVVPAEGDSQAAIVTLFPTNVSQTLGDQLVPNDGDSHTVLVDVKFQGELLDGSDIDSQTFRFPVTVCRGCSPCAEPECVCSHFVR